MLNKLRAAALGNAAPMVAKLQPWGVEFAAKGQLEELKPEDVGYAAADFSGAMKSVTYDGKTFGVPTNNETMPGVGLERRALQGSRARPRDPAGDLGQPGRRR